MKKITIKLKDTPVKMTIYNGKLLILSNINNGSLNKSNISNISLIDLKDYRKENIKSLEEYLVIC